MPSFRIPRTGLPALALSGQQLSRTQDAEPEGKRRYEVAVVRSEAGPIVLAVTFASSWPRESPHHWAIVAAGVAQLTQQLSAFDPIPPGVGFPAGDQFRDKQLRLDAALKAAFGRAVSRGLDEAGIVEEI